MKAKYVILLHQGIEVPVLLPEAGGLMHSEAAKMGHATAAAFCELLDGEFFVHGESESLRLKNRGERDAYLLQKFYGRQATVAGPATTTNQNEK